MAAKNSDSIDHTDLEKTLATLTIVDDPLTENTTQPSAVEVDEGSPKTANPNTFDDDDDDDDLIAIDPVVDPWSDIPEGDDPFTEEELINVLRSFEEDPEDDDDDHPEDTVEFPTGEALSELDFDKGDDSLLLAPAEFTASIFDPSPTEVDNNYNTTDIQETEYLDKDPLLTGPIIPESETLGTEPLDDEKKGDFDDDEYLGLLEGLQKLNLAWPSEEDEDDDDDIPPYLYCQPCTPGGTILEDTATSFSLASIAEDQALLDPSAAVALRQLQSERPRLPDKEFDTLLHLSLLNVDDGGNPYLSEAEMDSLFEMGQDGAHAHDAAASVQANGRWEEDGDLNNHHQHIFPEDHHQHQQHQTHNSDEQQQVFDVSRRPEALDCASEILSSFLPNRAGILANERSCIGHKETIFGAAFSECCQYLATASQDSTVRIWDAKTNAALSTLKEHSTDYECLRVAWYVVLNCWFWHCRPLKYGWSVLRQLTGIVLFFGMRFDLDLEGLLPIGRTTHSTEEQKVISSR